MRKVVKIFVKIYVSHYVELANNLYEITLRMKK